MLYFVKNIWIVQLDALILSQHITNMESHFKNLQQLLDFFKDDTTCKEYYEQKRWGGNVACVHCGSLKVYRTNRGFKCGEKLCARNSALLLGQFLKIQK